MSCENRRDRRFGRAWIALTLTLAAHVVDEATTGFLDVYNPIVLAARQRIGWFPMPVFTFEVWITGLAVLVLVLLATSPLAFKCSLVARAAAYPYAVIMLLNGVGHFAGSIYLQRWAPGTRTAPLLIAASLWLLSSVRQQRPHHAFA